MKVASTSLITLAIAAEVIIGSSASSSSTSIHRRGVARKIRRAIDTNGDETHSVTLQKRDFHGTGTFYGAGVSMGACGHWSDPADNVVALNIGLYGNPNAQSDWCGRTVTITSGGQTAQATIVDCCPTCPGNGDLDMSKALFQQFGDLSQGVLDISWHVGGGGGGGTSHKSNNNNNNDNNNNNNNNHQDTHKTTTAKAKPTTQLVTQTLFSTMTSTSTSATASTATGTNTDASGATTAASSNSTDVPDSNAQNLAGISQLLQGMFNMANAVQS